MPPRIDLGRALLLLGAALLFASLFVDWYEEGLTAWDAFEVLDLLLLALAAAAAYAALRPDGLPRAAVPAIAGTALVIVVVQLLNPPPAASGLDPDVGAWLALAAAVVLVAGAVLALARISVSVQVAERDVRRRMPAVDRRDAVREDGPSAAATAAPAAVADPADLDDAGTERTQPLRVLPDEDEDPDRP
jgi:hypothetical protein